MSTLSPSLLPLTSVDKEITNMEHGTDQTDGLLRQPSSHLSDYSLNSNSTLVTSPSSPPLHRQDHLRANSAIEENASVHGASGAQQDAHGLGISSLNEQKRVSFTRKPDENQSSSGTPGSAGLLLSPMSAYRSGEDRFDGDQEEHLRSGFSPESHQAFKSNSDREPLRESFPPTEVDFECRMKKPPENGRGSWLAVSILIMSIYSTVFSGIWLTLAIMRLPYGHTVSRVGVPFATASTLYTAFAKSIELSFVAVFVAFVGQVLSKRAIIQPKGITTADMSIRSWVIQPGRYFSG